MEKRECNQKSPEKGIDRFRPASLARLLFVFLQLCLLTLILLPVCWFLQNKAFNQVTMLAFSGFLVHHLLPMGWRLPFFAILSIASVLIVFGIFPGVWLLFFGLMFIGICHLPLSLRIRIVILISIGAAIAVLRLEAPHWQEMTAVWPILGSMFMFRLIIYLYDLRHNAAPFHLSRSVAYFLMLPNVCFPMFPVVDYKTFCRSYYNDDPFRIYQTGIRWMLRGIIQLILYRLVYQYLMNDPAGIDSIGGLFRYMTTTVLLYLRISGDFHLIIGMLHLFGFNLPEAQHRWLLASSFLDYWRRVNIYWRDFMQKIVFYPLFFRLRPLGNVRATMIASAGVIASTWLLHSYQWFWIRGSFPVTYQDILFWTILGVLMITNFWWAGRPGRQRSRSTRVRGLKTNLSLAARTMGMFIFIILLWSVWTTESFEQWYSMIASADRVSLNDVLLIAAVVGSIGIGAILMGRTKREWTGQITLTDTPKVPAFRFWRSAAVTGAVSLLLVLLSLTEVHWLFGPRTANVLKSLKTNRLNQQDMKMLERGYYEELTNTMRISPELWEVYQKEPPNWRSGSLLRESPDNPYLRDLIPSERTVSKGKVLTTNRWGMRDRNYEREKPPNTYRIGLLGGSRTMGWGVEDDQTFENLLEDRLNQEIQGELRPRYEILNFAVAGSGLIHKLTTLEEKAFDFDLDSVFYVPGNDFRWIIRDMARYSSMGFEIPYPELARIAADAGVKSGFQFQILAARRLDPHAEEMVRLLFERMSNECRERGLPIYLLIVPSEGGESEERNRENAKSIELAQNAGFIVIDVRDAYRDVENPQSLMLAAWDYHPNDEAHQLLANELFKQLQPHLTMMTIPRN
jgi:D-alanyl-lipoteichoic acid acyltransferase DltB (MBOAT superfamily)